jgi:hypothetical protein
MMRIVFTTLAIISMIAPGVAFAADRNEKKNNDDGCSVATLYGPYLFTGEAASPEPVHQAGYPRRFAGVYTFDGEGKMSGVASQSRGGVTFERIAVSATYTLDDDCTGTITYTAAGERFHIFISRDGREGNFIRVDQGTIATRTIKRQ